jgi:hypothetical protein
MIDRPDDRRQNQARGELRAPSSVVASDRLQGIDGYALPCRRGRVKGLTHFTADRGCYETVVRRA